MSTVAYEKRRRLLDELADGDRRLDWAGRFSQAAERTEMELAERVAPDAGPRTRWWFRAAYTAAIGVAGGIMFALSSVLSGHAVHWLFTTQQSSIWIWVAVIGAMSATLGAVGSLTAASCAIGQARERRRARPPSEPHPEIPAPVRYWLTGAVAPTGQLQAHITRQAPDETKPQAAGAVILGFDEDGETLTVRFDTLLGELRELERSVGMEYERQLAAHGLDEQGLPGTRARLARRLEAMREQRQLNEGLAQSLTTHSLQTFSATVWR